MSLFANFGRNLAGGALLGLSADTLLLLNGDIFGCSGLASGVLINLKKNVTEPQQHWRVAFLAAFLSTATFLLGSHYDVNTAYSMMNFRPISNLGYAIGGLLVGFGTKLGNGCTSGHGICGLARFSKRSFCAVGTFMATGMAAAILTDPESTTFGTMTSFLRTDSFENEKMTSVGMGLTLATLAAALVAPLFHRSKKVNENDRRKLFGAVTGGVLSSLGLFLSEMVYPSKVFGCLKFTGLKDGTWDPALMFVMGGGVVISFLGYQFIENHRVIQSTKPVQKPICLTGQCDFSSVPSNTVVDKNLLVGEALFGIGWGVSGLCPGAAMVLAAMGVPGVLKSWLPAYALGAYLADVYKSNNASSPKQEKKV